jgi:anti-sigma B factor antagonist
MSELSAVEVMRSRVGALQQRPREMTMVLEGELGRDELLEVGEMLVRLSIEGALFVIVDLTRVSHLDYRGIAALVRRAEVFRELGGDITLSGLSPYLFAIFQAAGAHDAFDFFATAADARRALDEPASMQGH